MLTASTATNAAGSAPVTAVGIDVGGARKGFHAVALTGGNYSRHVSTQDVEELAHWCRVTVRAQVIAVDAPCRWSQDGRARPAERQLMEKRIWCFSTPTRERALAHPLNHFGWMLRGEALFQALEPTHALCCALPLPVGAMCCLETFPHAAAWHLTGGQVTAKRKRVQRTQLLQQSGIDTSRLSNIDLIDAALCALVAYRAATGAPCAAYGETDTGLIIVPAAKTLGG